MTEVLDTLVTVPETLDAALLRRWAGGCVDVLDSYQEEIDRINVFPVADSDTGTNLLLTMRAATDALARRLSESTTNGLAAADTAAALASGALLGARGNSGVILSQVLRGVAEAVAEDAGSAAGGDGTVLVRALARAEVLATAAVAEPREGTVLSVLRAAAVAAAAGGSKALDEVARQCVEAAEAALARTPQQLAVLARAGVVDAGGRGLVLLLEALVATVTGGRLPAPDPDGDPQRRETRPVRDRDALLADREGGSDEFDYEVMYLLDGSTEARVAALRAELCGMGDSVAVVGDGTLGGEGLWNVHVHCTDVGAAVEAGITAGRPHRITVVRFADQIAEQAAAAERVAAAGRFTRDRGVLAVIAGEPAAELARGEGATVVLADPRHPPGVGELTAALAGIRARHVVVLPNHPELNTTAEQAAASARRDGQDVVVVPTSSVLQGLAALAVHDPDRRAGDDVVAMAEAAAGTRVGGVLVADAEALTWVGRCNPGDVLGLSDGEVVIIEKDAEAAARRLADRMLHNGGELLTLLLGADADAELGAALQAHLRRTRPEVEVVVYLGGQPDYLLLLGLE